MNFICGSKAKQNQRVFTVTEELDSQVMRKFYGKFPYLLPGAWNDVPVCCVFGKIFVFNPFIYNYLYLYFDYMLFFKTRRINWVFTVLLFKYLHSDLYLLVLLLIISHSSACLFYLKSYKNSDQCCKSFSFKPQNQMRGIEIS